MRILLSILTIIAMLAPSTSLVVKASMISNGYTRAAKPFDLASLKARTSIGVPQRRGTTFKSLSLQGRPLLAPGSLRNFLELRAHRVPLTSFLSATPSTSSFLGTSVATHSATVLRESMVAAHGTFSRATKANIVNSGTSANTGIRPWWTFVSGSLPGVGRYELNAKTGNVIAMATDMSIAHKGVPFVFTRTYNSFSAHDYANSDGSVASNYGGGWTNTFDAHISRNTSNGISVFDTTGARHDYTGSDSAGYIGGTGERAGLVYIAQYDSYDWVQPSGVILTFYNPTQSASAAALAGRLGQIYGRNENSYITFAYTFDGGDSSTQTKLNEITATAEDGEVATLAFATINGQRLLSSLTWPDKTQVTYGYDSVGDLTLVKKPGNNAASAVAQGYSYASGTSHELTEVVSPRYYAAGIDGAYITFGYSTGDVVDEISYSGYINPQINDGYSSGALQSSMPTGLQDWSDTTFSYGSTANSTTANDSDGRRVVYHWDTSNDRIVQADRYVTASLKISTSQTWSSANYLSSSTDARGNVLNMQYDAAGNVVAIGQPVTTMAGGGRYKPTTLISYDANDNPVASCDPVFVHSLGLDWSGSGPASSDSLCPSEAGASRFTWTSTTADPVGELTQTISRLGYHRTVAYDPSSQGGSDYGLPTSVVGDAINQDDGTARTPTSMYQYDAHGNSICVYSGVGWTANVFDSANRVVASGDPDDGSLAGCGKSSSSMTTASYRYFYPNGQVSKTETSAQHAGGTGRSYSYDMDGNMTSYMSHFGNVAGTSKMFYDAAERPVEAVAPHDSTDFYSQPFMRRYFYDLTKGGTVTVGSASNLKAHGDKFLTQEYLDGSTQSGLTPTGSPSWMAVSGSSADAVDRPVALYDLAMSPSNPVRTNTYDGSSNMTGLLTSSADATGEMSMYAYDERSNLSGVTFAGDGGVTPAKTFDYDADGRTADLISSAYGAQKNVYDADGRLKSVLEPAGSGLSSSGTTTYGSYADGSRESTTSSAVNGGKKLLSYSYRADGLVQTKSIGMVATKPFTYTYTKAGRFLNRADSYSGVIISSVDPPYDNTKTYTLGNRTTAYDSFGRPSSLTLPMGGAETGMTYDAEGELTSYQGFNIYGTVDNPRTATNTFNVRGEQIGMQFSADYRQSVLADRPIAYYRLADAGTTAVDSSGNGLNGTVGSAVTKGTSSLLKSEPGDTAMTFPGGSEATTSQVRVAPKPSMQPSSAVSIDAWVKPGAQVGSSPDVASYGNDASSEPYSVSLLSSGHVAFWTHTSSDSGSSIVSKGTVSQGAVAYVAATYNGSTRSIYINGTLDTSASESGTLAGYDGTNGFAIGGGYALSDNTFAGGVQEVAIYAMALSASRIAVHYAAGSGTVVTPSTSVRRLSVNMAPIRTAVSSTYGATADATWPHYNDSSANGTLVQQCVTGVSPCPPSQQFDAIDGQILKTLQTSSSKTYSHDANGRQSNAALAFTAGSGSYKRSYDAENHLIGHNFTSYDTPSLRPDCTGNYADDGAYNASMTYKWGPNGHPVIMGNETLHWDGDQLLYTSNSSGVDDVKVGHLADIKPSNSQIVVWDRDASGAVVSSHNGAGFGGWTPPDPYGQRCASGAPASSKSFATAYTSTPFVPIMSPAIDGITDGANVIQGRRAFDSKAEQWISRDASRGSSTNLLSQKPYAWNGNNAQTQADPTGNDTLFIVTRPTLAEFGPFVQSLVGNANHAYLLVVADDGTQTAYGAYEQFGPGLNVYVQTQVNNPADDNLMLATGLTLVANCLGICNGESAAVSAYTNFPADAYYYDALSSNSNSVAAYSEAQGGYNVSSYTNSPYLPGINTPLQPAVPISPAQFAPGDVGQAPAFGQTSLSSQLAANEAQIGSSDPAGTGDSYASETGGFGITGGGSGFGDPNQQLEQ